MNIATAVARDAGVVSLSRWRVWRHKRKQLANIRREKAGFFGPVLGAIFSKEARGFVWEVEDYAHWMAIGTAIGAVILFLFSASILWPAVILGLAGIVLASKWAWPYYYRNGGGAEWECEWYGPAEIEREISTMPEFVQERVRAVVARYSSAHMIRQWFFEDPIIEMEINGDRVIVAVYDEDGNEVML